MYQNAAYYKPDMESVIRKMTKTREDALQKKNGNILFRVLPPSDIRLFSEIAVDSYDYEEDLDQYIQDLSAAYARSFEARLGIRDDALPLITPVLGIGDYSAFLAGDIHFSKDTSWSKPSLEEINEWRSLPAIGTTYWYKKFLAICDKMLEAAKGTGIPFTRGFFSPLDLAEALRGNKLYYDFTDNPDELHDLLDFCADATIRFAEDIYAIARRHLSEEPYGLWFIENSINMSEDIACMISPDLYREFGAPHTQKVIDHFGKAFMHTHSRALYMVKEICSLRNVANLWLATDPSQPIPVQCLEQLIPDAQSTCLAIDCASFEEFEETLDTALTGNVSYCLPVDTLEDGIDRTDRANALLSRKGVL
ncbi:MAG: uroporphyrinogen decarboxylase/cobalamine-independent methonine synthase family protein [Saccharofermentanales bacterium]